MHVAAAAPLPMTLLHVHMHACIHAVLRGAGSTTSCVINIASLDYHPFFLPLFLIVNAWLHTFCTNACIRGLSSTFVFYTCIYSSYT